MARRKQQQDETIKEEVPTHESEQNKSIGSQMSAKGRTQGERNLAVKAELIKKGLHPKSTVSPGATQKQKNLALKAKLKADGKKG